MANVNIKTNQLNQIVWLYVTRLFAVNCFCAHVCPLLVFLKTDVHSVITTSLSEWQSPLDDMSELKQMNIKISDIEMLMAIRATYVIQLVISIAGSSSKNLKPLFEAMRTSQTCVQKLADLDTCLLSLESMNGGWSAALTDMLSTGSFDLRSVLQTIGAKGITSLGQKLLGQPGSTGDSKDANAPDVSMDGSDETMLSWTDLMSFGADDCMVPSADKLMMLQLTLQATLLKIANESETKWRSRVIAHLKLLNREASSKRSSAGNMSCELLLRIEKSEAVRESMVEPGLFYYNLPDDFKLYFFGGVGRWVMDFETRCFFFLFSCMILYCFRSVANSSCNVIKLHQIT